MNKTKQRGYVLMLVLLLTFLMAAAVTATFVVVHRYEQLAKRALERLRTDVLAEETEVSQEAESRWEDWSWTS